MKLTKSKLAAIRLTVEAVFAFAAIIFVVLHFEADLQRINWRLVALLCGVVAMAAAIYRWQMRPDNTYDALDMLMKDGKADLNAHFQVVFAALAVWVVVQQALAKQPVTELVLGVLGIFVAGKAIGKFADRPVATPIDQSQNVNVLPDAKIQAAATPAAPAAPSPLPAPEVSQYHG